MMKFSELKERKYEWIDHEKNPSIRHIWNLLHDSKDKAIRLAYDVYNDDLYVWDAWDAEHDHFEIVMQLKDQISRGYIDYNEKYMDIPEPMEQKSKIIQKFMEKYEYEVYDR